MSWSGRISRFTTEGTIVIRSKEAAPIGRPVCDNHGRDLGNVVRVTGPVGSPYIIVRPKGPLPDGAAKMVGREVFLSRTQYQPRDRRKERRPDARNDRRVPGKGQRQRYEKGEQQDRRRVHRSMDRSPRG